MDSHTPLPESERRLSGATEDLQPTQVDPSARLADPALDPAARFAECTTAALSPHTPDGRSAQPWPLPAGALLGKYRLLEEVARGGMGVVYKAKHPTLDRVVALKTVRADLALRRDGARRFYREAQAAAQLNHPNIVSVLDYGEHGGHHYLTMAFVDGGSLAQRHECYQSDPRAAVALLEKIARAVQYAHEHGVLHRDLKPSNVLLDQRGEPVITDFGLAKLLDSDDDLTLPGAVLGTPAYMAPEQAAGEPLGPASDVWSLGVMLFELLAGHRPFAARTVPELQLLVERGDPPSLRSVNRKLDRGLEAVVLKCLQRDPRRRYFSAGALADELDRWLRGEPLQTREDPWLLRAWRAVRRHRRTALLAAVGAGVLGTLVFLYLSRPERAREADRDTLERGEAITYIDAGGRPVRAKSLIDVAHTVVVAPDSDAGGLGLNAATLGLLEIAAEPPAKGYRLQADVLHRGGSAAAKAGIYFDRQVRADGTATLFTWTFHGSGDLSYSVPRGVQPRQVWFDLEAFTPARGSMAAFTAAALPLDPVGTPWRKDCWRALAADITPKRVRLWWDGKLVSDVVKARVVADALRENPPFLGGNTAKLDVSGGGCGLYLSEGSALFRRVIIEPLRQP